MTMDNEFRNLWRSKLPLSTMAEKYGVDVSTISRWARRDGLDARARGTAPSGPKPPPRDAAPATMTEQQRADYATYRKAGYSVDEAARKAAAPKVKIRATPKGQKHDA